MEEEIVDYVFAGVKMHLTRFEKEYFVVIKAETKVEMTNEIVENVNGSEKEWQEG